jgi:uncharacterized membrane protein
MLGKFVEAIVAATALVYLTDSRTKTMQVKYTRTMAAIHCFSFGFPLLSVVFQYFSKLFHIYVTLTFNRGEIQLTKKENQKKNTNKLKLKTFSFSQNKHC